MKPQYSKSTTKPSRFHVSFVGITVACAFWYAVLPTSTINSVFDKQIGTIQSINNQVSEM